MKDEIHKRIVDCIGTDAVGKEVRSSLFPLRDRWSVWLLMLNIVVVSELTRMSVYWPLVDQLEEEEEQHARH